MRKAEAMARLAKAASRKMSFADAKAKNNALETLARLINENSSAILSANEIDIRRAEKNKLSAPMLKRLKLDHDKISLMAEEALSVAKLPEPSGKTLMARELDSNLELFKVSVPIGVICCIFESRPDVLIQICSLCIKSGNAVLLKGGSEAANTNKVLFSLVRKSLKENGLCENAVHLLEGRKHVNEILKLDKYIDLIIPRGSSQLVRFIQKNTRIAVLGHSSGICHVYVDALADLEKAAKVCLDAKAQYPAVCNAMETMLVHSAVAGKFLPYVCKEMLAKGISFFADEEAMMILKASKITAKKATEKNFATEYNDLKLNVKVVADLDEAIEHINKYGSGHTDSIITEDKQNALKFVRLVDSADVFWNASTRFSDGYRYGFGAEVGINTGKIHARGPSGIDSLLTYKYVLVGKGNIVADYIGKAAKRFTHKALEKEWTNDFI